MSRSRRRLAFSAILLATLLGALDQTIVATALPRIVEDLGGFNSLSWVVSAYLLASTVTIPLYGKLSDLYGRRMLFVVAITLFLVGSVLCGLASSMEQLIAFRALKGLGAGGLVPLSQAAIGDLFSPRERGRYQGYISSMWGIAAIGGPVLGGVLTQAISWRWIFYINVPLCLVALLIVVKTLPGGRGSHHRIDYGGAITLGASLGAILLACAWSGTTYPISSWQVIVPFAAGLAGAGVFILIERRATEPIIPSGLFRNRAFLAGTGAFFVVGAVIFTVSTYMPVYLQQVRGHSPTVAGLLMIAFVGTWSSLAFCTGRLITRTGRYRPFPIIGTSVATLGIAMMALLGQTTSPVVICLVLAIGGAGMGMIQSPFLVGVQNTISPTMLGTASGTMNLSRAIGGSLAVSGLGAVLTTRATAELGREPGANAHGTDINALIAGEHAGPIHDAAVVGPALLSGMQLIYVITAIVAGLGVICALALPNRSLSTEVTRR